jgi:hypothetical protein
VSRSQRLQLLLCVLSGVACVAASAAFAWHLTSSEFAWFLIVASVWTARTADVESERAKRILAEQFSDDVTATCVRMVLSAARGNTLSVSVPGCDCAACVSARARKDGLPS